MNISKCAFSATVVNNRFIYTFGGYDGQNRLDAIERYSISEGDWLLLKIKLKLPLSNCACFCPEPDKVVVFGGGFSSGFSPYVEQIDIKTGVWKTLPVMNEGRDLRNKVCFIDDHAYAVGGLNSKAEKFSFKEKSGRLFQSTLCLTTWIRGLVLSATCLKSTQIFRSATRLPSLVAFKKSQRSLNAYWRKKKPSTLR